MLVSLFEKVIILVHFLFTFGHMETGSVSEGWLLSQVTHVAVAVPPKWTPADMQAPAAVSEQNGHNEEEALSMSMYMEAPLVDCVRTRWQRARCKWTGESPSLV
jgi:hypothetical protein